VAIFAGKNDKLANTTDARWIRDTMNKQAMVHYQEINGGHVTFMVAKDTTWFTEDVMGLIKKYQPINPTEFLQ